MVKVNIVLDDARIFLFPASVAPTPGDNDDAPAPPDDTTVRGEIVLSSDEQARVGPIRVVWEVARESKKKDATWGKREVLARFESEVTSDDTLIQIGDTRMVFTFQIPSLLPPTSETAFTKTSHTLVASVLEAAPEYHLGPSPAYDDCFSIPSSSPRGSISSFGDWSFPSDSSRRSSLLTSDQDQSRRSSIDSRRPSMSSEIGSRRSSLVNNSSRRGSAEGELKKKKGLFSGFRRKSSVATSTSGPATEESIKLSTPVPTCDGLELAEWLLPSTAGSTKSLEIVSCPAAKGELCTVSWSKNSNTAGLGHSERYVQSDVFSLGSGVNFDYKLSEIPDSSTIHSIRLSLRQETKASNGDSEEEIFTLFSRGSKSEGDHVWRGEVPRTWDGQVGKKSSKHQTTGPTAQACIPGVIADPSSIRIRTKARLPTSIAGAVPTSPRLIDNRLARVTHYLRIETLFSVLGQDVDGSVLPLNTKSKDGRPREGEIRRTWVDHEVTLGACCITPENILVPTYSASSSNTASVKDQYSTQIRTNLESFAMPKTCTHTIRSESATKTSERQEQLPPNGADRLIQHARENHSRCLCFHSDSAISEMIGSLEKPQQEINLPMIIDLGGMVKSLYVPAIDREQVDETVAVAQDVLRSHTSVVACA